MTAAQNILSKTSSIWPISPLYLGVGQKTAHVLSKACKQKVNYPQVSDSEHLLKLTELNGVENKSILILRGNGGRELIRDSLLNRGAQVSYCETYRREYIPISDHNTYQTWINKKRPKLSSLVRNNWSIFAQLPLMSIWLGFQQDIYLSQASAL